MLRSPACQRHHLGRQRRAALLPAAGPDLSAPAMSARPSCCPRTLEAARGPAQAPAAICWPGVPRGARPRQAAAQRAAGAVSGAVPRGRARRRPGAPVGRPAKEVLRANPSMRGVNDNWNENIKVLRLDIDQDKARALGVTSQAIAQAARTILSRQHHRPVPRGRPADRHRAAPAAGRAQRHHRPGNAYLPTASGRSVPLTQIAKVSFAGSRASCGAKGRDLRHHGAGRRGRGRAGPDRHRAGLAAAAGTGRAHAHRATASRWPARWKKAARARARSPPACR
jgi:hypothetical protein